ncbi:MAG: tetratricopeptide repeat protein [Candidatus Micrarchaeota archaeon]|nr:tetratricopeptide repeat protein [Candidatus Micrarchaeota archaeon]
MTDELEDQMIAKTEQFVEEKKGDEAVQEATELAQIDPKDAIVWFVKGKAHYVDLQFEEALACLSKAAQIDRQKPEIWHMMGYVLISLNRLQEAEEALAYVKATQPTNTEAVCALGIVQVMQGKAEEARKNFEVAMALDKSLSISMLEHFHDKYFAISKTTDSRTKAMIERLLETLKIVR